MPSLPHYQHAPPALDLSAKHEDQMPASRRISIPLIKMTRELLDQDLTCSLISSEFSSFMFMYLGFLWTSFSLLWLCTTQATVQMILAKFYFGHFLGFTHPCESCTFFIHILHSVKIYTKFCLQTCFTRRTLMIDICTPQIIFSFFLFLRLKFLCVPCFIKI